MFVCDYLSLSVNSWV